MLRGGREFLSKNRPIVSLEYGDTGYSAYGCDAMTLYEVAVENGYALVDLFGNIMEREGWPLVVDAYYWDYILFPQERMESTAAQRMEIRKAAMRSATHPQPHVERWRKRLRR